MKWNLISVAVLSRRSAMPSATPKVMLDKPRSNHVDLITDMELYCKSYVCDKCRQLFKVRELNDYNDICINIKK